jgi:fibronectin type 3 domain-containing protein
MYSIMRFKLLVIMTLVYSTAILQAQKPPTKTPKNENIVADSIQKLPQKLIGVARATGDSVILRWAPSTVGMWLALSSSGVVIERFEMDATTKQLSKSQRLTPEPIRAWDSLKWKPAVQKSDNPMFLLAAQCLLGEWSVPQTSTIESFRTAVGNQGNKFTFAMLAADNNPLAAEGLGLRFVDKSAKRGATYIYRIYPSNKEKIYRDTAIILCVNTPYTGGTAPVNLRADEREGRVLLQWDALPGASFSGYYIYRQAKDGKEVKLNSLPLFTLVQPGKKTYTNSFEDTASGNYIPYTYRVRGVDMFGSESPAAEIIAMGRDRTPPPAPSIKKPFGYAGSSILLEWEMTVPPGDLAGFVVMKSDSAASRYYPLHKDYLPKSATQFVDTAGNEDEPYYTVIAVDTAGNSSALQMVYAEVRDTIPPQTPQVVRGTVDTNGVVRLIWNLGAEKDLLGYRVLWANQRDHEFTQKSNLVLLDTVFTDTILIQTLTLNVYYKVVAVDTRYLHSIPTDIIELRRPDIVPPETPFIRSVFVEPKSVHLEFAPSGSKDVKEHRLERKIPSETAWALHAQLSATASAYTDTLVIQNTMYEYRLIAIDSSNLASLPSPSVVGRPYDTGVRPVVDSIRCVYDSVSNSVKISWEYPSKPVDKYWFVLYRAYDENDLTQLAAVPSTTREFIDTKLFGYGRYRYAIRMISERGESPLSEEVTVAVTR